MIYWCVFQSSGKIKQHQFYWGALPRRKIDRLLHLINHRPPRAKHRIARMIGLKFNDISDVYLQNSKFLKKYILSELKNKEKAEHKVDKRFLTGDARRTIRVAHPRNYFQEFWHWAVKTRVSFQKLEQEDGPMETWEENKKNTFFQVMEEIEPMIYRARKMRDSMK
jgi:hypothetical protein